MMATVAAVQEIVRQKLEAFDRMEQEFEESFRFVQGVHGQKRLEEFPIVEIVRYMHALWVCDCKGKLLSVPRSWKLPS